MKQETRKVILVVEDEKPLLEAIYVKLEKSSFSVVAARNAEQAYELIKNIQTIDAIWLDHYLLGQENGLDIVAKLKNDDKYKSIPIFIVSNTAGPEKVQSYINLGVNQYYIKSNCRLDKIISDIKDCLTKKTIK